MQRKPRMLLRIEASRPASHVLLGEADIVSTVEFFDTGSDYVIRDVETKVHALGITSTLRKRELRFTSFAPAYVVAGKLVHECTKPRDPSPSALRSNGTGTTEE